jgi:sensor histidine kinase YesM
MASPLQEFFLVLKDWIRERYWRMCFLPSTLLAILLTLFFILTLTLPMTFVAIGRAFFITAVFTYSIGSVLLVMWGMWSNAPVRLSRIQRHILGIIGVILGVFLGTNFAVVFVADMLGRSFWDVVTKVLVFNLFMTVVVIGLMVVYEQMRQRLEKTLEQLKEKEVTEQRLLRLKTQAELSSLQARINPHFLFNSLNTIASLVTIDPKRAETAVEMLSKLLRFSLRSSERRVVQLAEEFEIVRTYLDLEKIRLGDRLKYDLRVEGDVSMVCIPGMLLQPLVENCIKHGFSRKVCGGVIRVSAIADAGRCRIVVEDNGVGWTQKSRDGGIGLANIRERLNLYFGGRCSLELYNREGAVVDISFPVEGSCTVL